MTKQLTWCEVSSYLTHRIFILCLASVLCSLFLLHAEWNGISKRQTFGLKPSSSSNNLAFNEKVSTILTTRKDVQTQPLKGRSEDEAVHNDPNIMPTTQEGSVVSTRHEVVHNVPNIMPTTQEGSVVSTRHEVVHKVPKIMSTTQDGTLVSTRARPNHDEVVNRLHKEIMHLSNVSRVRPFIPKTLRETLESCTTDLEPLLSQLLNFTANYRCRDCSDDRFPRTLLNLGTVIKHNETWQGYTLPILASQPSGRLGNIMGQYATIYALNRIYNVTGLATLEEKKALQKYFPHLSLPTVVVEKAGWQILGVDQVGPPWTFKFLQLAAAGLLGARRFLTGSSIFELHLFHAYRQEILKELSFADSITNRANKLLEEFAAKSVRSDNEESVPLTFIGVHIRLGDYPHHMSNHGVKNLTYDDYLERAIKYMKNLHQNVVFVVVSDNVAYAQNYFLHSGEKNVFISHGNAAEDMCLLSKCNHTIVTLGSFGFWCGYLGTGITVYPDMDLPPNELYLFGSLAYHEASITSFVPLPLFSKDLVG